MSLFEDKSCGCGPAPHPAPPDIPAGLSELHSCGDVMGRRVGIRPRWRIGVALGEPALIPLRLLIRARLSVPRYDANRRG